MRRLTREFMRFLSSYAEQARGLDITGELDGESKAIR